MSIRLLWVNILATALCVVAFYLIVKIKEDIALDKLTTRQNLVNTQMLKPVSYTHLTLPTNREV